MKDVPATINYAHYDVLGMDIRMSLLRYGTVAAMDYPWTDYSVLTQETLFDPAFLGLDTLDGLLESFSHVRTCMYKLNLYCKPIY